MLHLSLRPSRHNSYFGLFAVSVETKKDEFLKQVAGLPESKVNLIVMHAAQATPEMNALVDMSNTDQHSESKPLVAMHCSDRINFFILA